MSIQEKASLTIANAEAELRRLIAEAANDGDYSSIEVVTRLASALAEIRLKHPTSTLSESSPGRVVETSPATAANRKTKEVRGVRKRRSYPYFARSGENLVKVAWSKSSKSEYQHKAPRIVAVKLAETLAQRSKKNAIVPMDGVLPLKFDDGSDIPDYQTYVSLAWLRHAGAVKQHGRQGYSIKKPSELLNYVEAAWAQLVEMRPS